MALFILVLKYGEQMKDVLTDFITIFVKGCHMILVIKIETYGAFNFSTKIWISDERCLSKFKFKKCICINKIY